MTFVIKLKRTIEMEVYRDFPTVLAARQWAKKQDPHDLALSYGNPVIDQTKLVSVKMD